MTRAHARLGPSSSSRWTQCPASIRLSQEIPERASGAAAAAGTLMHSVFERLLLNQEHLSPAEIEELSQLDFGEQRARQIIDQGVTAARVAMSRYKLSEFVTEVRVDPGRCIERDDFWGTADLIGADPHQRILLVGDFKTGRGRVDVRENKQLMSYALGSLELLNFTPERVILAILQPPLWGGNPAIWETSLMDLHAFEQYVKAQASLTDRIDTQPTPSEDACVWCPAKAVCPVWKAR